MGSCVWAQNRWTPSEFTSCQLPCLWGNNFLLSPLENEQEKHQGDRNLEIQGDKSVACFSQISAWNKPHTSQLWLLPFHSSLHVMKFCVFFLILVKYAQHFNHVYIQREMLTIHGKCRHSNTIQFALELKTEKKKIKPNKNIWYDG